MFLGAAVSKQLSLIAFWLRVTERVTTVFLVQTDQFTHTYTQAQWSEVTADTGLFVIVTQVSGHTGNFLFRGKVSQWVSEAASELLIINIFICCFHLCLHLTGYKIYHLYLYNSGIWAILCVELKCVCSVCECVEVESGTTLHSLLHTFFNHRWYQSISTFLLVNVSTLTKCMTSMI